MRGRTVEKREKRRKVRKHTGFEDRDVTHLYTDDDLVRLRLAEGTVLENEVVKRVSLERLSNDDGASGGGKLLSGGHGGASEEGPVGRCGP